MRGIDIEIHLKKKKNAKRGYGKNRYHKMSEKKTKIRRIPKNYREARRSQYNNE